jgi:hypothetical protein
MNKIETESMDPHIDRVLAVLEPTPERHPEKVAQGRAAFLQQATELSSTVSPAPIQRHRWWMLPIFYKEKRNMFTTITSILVALALLFGGAGATAFAAEGSQPDEPLYEVKTLTEQIQLKLAGSPEQEVALQSRFIDRRFQELVGLIGEDKPVGETFMYRINQQMEKMLQLAAGLNDVEMKQVLQQYQAKLQEQYAYMHNIGEPAADAAQEALRTELKAQIQLHLMLCDEGLLDPLLLRTRLMLAENGNAMPPEMVPGAGPVEVPPTYQHQFGQPEDKVPAENHQGPSENSNPENGTGPEGGPNAGPQPNTGPNQNGNGTPSTGGTNGGSNGGTNGGSNGGGSGGGR